MCTKCGARLRRRRAPAGFPEWVDPLSTYRLGPDACPFYGLHRPDPIVDNGLLARLILRRPKHEERTGA